MNRFFVTVIVILSALGVQGQGRKYSSNFSAYQHFYNPALTGHEGSIVKTLYRNQWTGFEDAPKTLFLTTELDAADLGRQQDRTGHYQYRSSSKGYPGARHAFGLVAFQDRFGPQRETQFGLNYGTGVQLSERLSLRFGTALTFNNFRIDGNSLVVDNTSDPRYQQMLGRFNSSSKVDLNLGFALTAGNFYAGYAMQDVTKGKILSTGDDFIEDVYTRKHILQAGFRQNLTEDFGIIVNGLYQYDEFVKGTVEGQVKGVYNNMLWLGVGYRNDLAYHVAAGLHYGRFRLNYAFESPIQEARFINRNSNEIGLAYTLKPNQNRNGRSALGFW